MKQQLFRCTFLVLLICFSVPIIVTAQVVDIPDPNLRTAVETALGKASGVTIIADEMATLTNLKAINTNISDLTGLEQATNLTYLNLAENSISDISPLEKLTNLTELVLWDNSISDISPVVRLTNLTGLALGGNNISDISPIAELTRLTSLHLPSNHISDVSAVSGLTHLRYLNLASTNITDISFLSGLTNLTELLLRNNSISDLSPLVANTGLGGGDTVDVRQNRLSDQSLFTHIPVLETRGVIVEFDHRSPRPTINTNGMVRLVYFVPSDRPVRPDRTAALRQLIEDAQQFYADEMHRHGLGRKAFTVETDNNGEPWVHQINGKFREDYYYSENLTDFAVGEELLEHFDGDDLQHVYFIAIDLSSESLSEGAGGLGSTIFYPASGDFGLGGGAKRRHRDITLGEELLGGFAIIPAHGHNFERLGLTVHELGHAFGLAHDFRQGRHSDYVMGFGRHNRLSKCAAEWLSISRFFNTKTNFHNEPGEIQLLSVQLYSQDAINFRFKVTDPDGLHQAQLLVPEILNGTGWGPYRLFDCKRLNGTTGTVESVVRTAEIADRITLQFIDIGGNITWATFPISLDEVISDQSKPTIPEYTLSIPAGISLIHVPLKVTAVDGVTQTIESISDFYDTLGGASTVNFLITYDASTQAWLSYSFPSDKGTPADRTLTDDTGIIVSLRTPVSVHLQGDALGTDGNSTITLKQGLNVVGLPLNDSRIIRVSDLFALEGIGGNVPVIILTDGGEFKAVGRPGDPGDIAITGGQAFIMTAQQTATVTISGDAWANGSGAAAAPPVARKGIEVGNTTPVLGLRGSIVNEGIGLNSVGFRITVKNLSTGKAVVAITAPDEADYRSTAVDIETGRAATVGDILELSAQSPNPFIGVEPLRYTVTAEDVKRSLIQLPELVAYEIPAETELLRNYPNPFNPETWIPYRLAEDAFVTLAIYDRAGQVVRTIDVGHQTAAVYENRSKAVYWDGRNRLGEQVASGVYFFHLSAGDYFATRKMVILK